MHVGCLLGPRFHHFSHGNYFQFAELIIDERKSTAVVASPQKIYNNPQMILSRKTAAKTNNT